MLMNTVAVLVKITENGKERTVARSIIDEATTKINILNFRIVVEYCSISGDSRKFFQGVPQ